MGLLAGPAHPGQYAQLGEPAAAPAIGKVERAEGTNSVQHADGTTGSLKLGDPIFEKDVVATEGSLGIRFNDGTVFSLSAGTRMVIDHLVYDPTSSSNSALFNVIKGTFSMVGGKIVDTGDMEVATPIATLGIRGSNSFGFVVDTLKGWLTTNTTDPDGSPSKVDVLDPATHKVLVTLTDLFSKVILTPDGIRIVATTPEERAQVEEAAKLLKDFYYSIEPTPQSAPDDYAPPILRRIDFQPDALPDSAPVPENVLVLSVPFSFLLSLPTDVGDEFLLQLGVVPAAPTPGEPVPPGGPVPVNPLPTLAVVPSGSILEVTQSSAARRTRPIGHAGRYRRRRRHADIRHPGRHRQW